MRINIGLCFFLTCRYSLPLLQKIFKRSFRFNSVHFDAKLRTWELSSGVSLWAIRLENKDSSFQFHFIFSSWTIAYVAFNNPYMNSNN